MHYDPMLAKVIVGPRRAKPRAAAPSPRFVTTPFSASTPTFPFCCESSSIRSSSTRPSTPASSIAKAQRSRDDHQPSCRKRHRCAQQQRTALEPRRPQAVATGSIQSLEAGVDEFSVESIGDGWYSSAMATTLAGGGREPRATGCSSTGRWRASTRAATEAKAPRGRGDAGVMSPMPATVVAINTAAGQAVPRERRSSCSKQ